MSKTFDLTTLNLSAGTHEITVKARASGYTDSPASDEVSYVVEGDTPDTPTEETYTVSGTWYFNYTLTYEWEGNTKISFISSGEKFMRLRVSSGVLAYMTFDEERGDWITVYSTTRISPQNLNPWKGYEPYRTITFDGVQEVSKEFKEWLEDNAERQTITFTIDGTTYYAKEGMTWGELVESEYNTGGYVWNANGVICNADETQSVYDGERPMHRSFLITNGCAYSLGAYNGGSGGSN
jgi:hypothetical protein